MIIAPKTRSVIVVRPFMFNGRTTVIGERLDLPNVFAMEMRSAHKVEIDVAISPPPAIEVPPPRVQEQAAKPPKGKKHA